MRHFLPAACLALLATSVISSAHAESQPRPELEGVFRHSGGERDRAALRRGIESVVGRMSVVIRDIARSRLAERVTIAPEVRIVRQRDTLYLDHEPIPLRRITSDGTPVTLTSAFGERVRVSTLRRGHTVRETIRHFGSRRLNVYRLSRDGRSMDVAVRIRSNLLPAPLRFRLRYSRQ